MEGWSIGRRWTWGAGRAAALGAVAGGLDALVRTLGARGLPDVVDDLVRGLVTVLVLALVGGLLGLLAGPVHTLRREAPGYRNVALQLGLAGGGLVAVELAPWIAALLGEGRTNAAVAMALVPVGGVATLTLNARFWLARRELGRSTMPFLPVALGAAVLCVGLAVLGGQTRDTGGSFALDGDPDVVVVSVDGLSVADGPLPAGGALAQLVATGTTFTQAVAPSADAVPSLAALWTGLHPLRHSALADDRALPAGLRTVVERLETEGYATAAFLSSAVATGVGLDQGFRVFDDAVAPAWARPPLVARVLGPWRVRRPALATVARFGQWLDGHAHLPFVAWVHLEQTADQGLPEVDAAVAQVLAALQRAEVLDRTLVVVVGTHGGQADAPRAGLGDALVHVPLVLRAPGRPRVPAVDVQVRLVDLPLTVLAWVGLDRNDEAEGIELLGFLDGRRDQGVWTPLVGRAGDGRFLLGLRQEEVKVVLDPALDDAEVYDLAEDPGEERNVAAQQAKALEQARSLLGPDLAALRRLEAQPALGPARLDVLRALGVMR